jgi:DNA-binding transcriptional MocR family regulator
LLVTGTVTSEERKWEIYTVAQDYNLLIIEDDPYYMLQYRGGVHSCTSKGGQGQG